VHDDVIELRPGQRLRSTACSTELVVVKGSGPLDLRCGGAPVTVLDDAEPVADAVPSPPFDDGTLVGKRYAHDGADLEVLCTKAGAGSLSVGDERVEQRSSKPLPSSD